MPENRQYDRVKEITDQLEAGIADLFNSEQYTTWLKTMSKFHDYSLNNTLLIAFQKPDATLVAGYTAWQKQFGRQVQKGEKAIRILAPTPYKQKVEMEKLDPVTQRPVLDENGNPVKEEKEILRSAFKVVSVFDVSQTQGREIPSLGVDELTGDVGEYEAFFEALKRSCPVPMEFEAIQGGAKGYYHQTDRRIALQEGMSELQTIKTAIHEMTHQRLHAVGPDQKPKDLPQQTRNSTEVEAESVAYTICQHFGIDTSDYSFAYIAGWSHGKETPELKASLMTIRKTASEMIGEIEGHLAEIHKEREAAVTPEEPVSEKEDPVPEISVEELLQSHPEFSPEQKAFITEMAGQGFDLKSFWVGGSPTDLTAGALSAEEIADIRYQMDADEIPKMLFTTEQWRQIEAGIKDRLDVRLYADPRFSAEQMEMIKRSLVAESHGYLSREDVQRIADPAHSAQEMKALMRDIRKESMKTAEAAKETAVSGLQENGMYRYYSTQRPVSIGTYPKDTGEPETIVNFDQREMVDGGKAQAWGYLEYKEPLTAKQIASYELRPAESQQEKPAEKTEENEKKAAEKAAEQKKEPKAKAPAKPRKKKSVLADLHAKQAMIAEAKAPAKVQTHAKEEHL